MTVRLTLLAIICAAVGLSACGKRGTLERPPPMFGHAHDQSSDDSERLPPTKYGQLPPAPESQNTSPRTDPLDGPSRGPDAGPNSPSNWLQQNQPHTR